MPKQDVKILDIKYYRLFIFLIANVVIGNVGVMLPQISFLPFFLGNEDSLNFLLIREDVREKLPSFYVRIYSLQHPEDFRIAFFKTNPGQFIKLTARLVVSFAAIFLGVAIYEFVVSEEKRLKYKYRHKHQHHAEEHH